MPGRSNYSFFCLQPGEAYTYARASCLRDVVYGQINSLILEPVVLKIKFTVRTWMQVDFLQELNPGEHDKALSLAVLGPVPAANIIDVLYCAHGKNLAKAGLANRSFEDGTLMEGIRHLRASLARSRPDIWMLRSLGLLTQRAGVQFTGGEMPELTCADNLRRLKKA